MSLFTNAQLVQVRSVLGYQNAWRFKNVRLESAFEQVDVDGLAFIVAELAAIAEVDAALRSGGVGMDAAGAAAVDKSLRFATARGENPSDQLRKLGRMHVSRISSILGVPVASDYYGTAGYPGDPWANGIGQNDMSSFDIKLG